MPRFRLPHSVWPLQWRNGQYHGQFTDRAIVTDATPR